MPKTYTLSSKSRAGKTHVITEEYGYLVCSCEAMRYGRKASCIHTATVAAQIRAEIEAAFWSVVTANQQQEWAI